MMKISLIAALSENNVIGKNNALPWHYPEDLQYFKKMTLEKPIIMGRKTFESMKKKPLPNRLNIILTHDTDYKATNDTHDIQHKTLNCTVVFSKEQALKACGDAKEVMVIGGSDIFKLFLPEASFLYLTRIHKNIEGDVFFPSIDWQHWQKISEDNRGEFSFLVFKKCNI